MATLRLLSTTILLLLFIASAMASNSEWINLTYSGQVTAINTDGNNIWVASRGGGLCKINIATGEKTFYNKGNSNISSNKVETIAIDAQNNIWIGTYDQGIAKFDGQTWEIFTSQNSDLPRNDIYDIKIDSEGNLWIGSLFGITKFDGADFTTYTIPAYSAATTLLVLAPDDIYMAWFENSFKGEIFHFDGTAIDTVNGFAQSSIYKLYSDNQNRVWACFNGGIALKDGNNWVIYDSTNSDIPNTQTRSLTETNGQLILGTDSGTYTFNGTTWVAGNTSTQNISYLLAVNNTLYIGTENDGLFSNNGGNVQHISTSAYAIPSSSFSQGFKDNDGKLLLRASYPRNMYSYFNNNWEPLEAVQNISNYSFFALAPDNSYWFCSYDSLYHFDGTNTVAWNLVDNGMPTSISAFEVSPSGTVHIGTYGNGFYTFDGTNWNLYNRTNSNLTSNKVRCFAFVNGNTWVGTNKELVQGTEYQGGIEVFDGNTFSLMHTGNSGLFTPYVTHMKTYGDSVWVGGDDGFGLYYNGTFTNYLHNNGSGSPITYTREMEIDAYGTIYVTGYNLNSEGVMVKYDGTTFKIFDATNSPIADFAYGLRDLVFDNDNNLWLLDVTGIYVYKEGGVTNINENTPTAIVPADALAGTKVYPNPASGFITIETPQAGGTITLFNLMGEKVLEQSFEGEVKTISTSSLNAGTYIYQLKTSIGKKTSILILN